MKKYKNIILLVSVLIIAAAGAVFVLPSDVGQKYLNLPKEFALYDNNPWRLGLDLVGGTALIYEVDLSGVEATDYEDTVSGLRDVVERRINQFGVAEPKVIIAQKGEGVYQLHVELAGVRDLKDAVAQIGETPFLEFRTFAGEGETVEIIPSGITGRHISRASVEIGNLNQPIVSFELNKEGAELFETVTEENVGRPLCIFVDQNFIFPEDSAASCPSVSEKISGGRAQISGGSITIESAKQLVGRFQAGALAAPINLVNQRTVSAASAESSLNQIIVAGAIGTALVMIFMVLTYGWNGLIANLALLIYTIITLAIFKLIPGFTMTLAGIAGFILSIGMAVDANILIFERTREEKKRGLAALSAIEEGFKRAWTSIRDSNTSTIITAFILYYFTSSFVRGFALTLGVGVVISMFSAIFVTRVILRAFNKDKNA